MCEITPVKSHPINLSYHARPSEVGDPTAPEVRFSEIPREARLNAGARKMVPVEFGGGGVCWIKAQWIKSSPGDCVRRS